MRLRLLLGPVLALSLLTPAPAWAGEPKPTTSAQAPAATAAPEEVAPDSPRAAVRRFFDLCRAGEYNEATSYLDLAEAKKAEGPLLAQRLKAVLDAQIWVQLDRISPLSLGDPGDHLPAGVDELGAVPGPNGAEPVRLVRRSYPDGPRWLFSRSTVDRVDDWYGRLRDRWLRDYLPERLLRPGPQELLLWQWIALPILFALALAAGKLLGFVTRRALRSSTDWDEALLARLGPPLTLLWAIVAVGFTLPRMSLYPPAEAFMERLLHGGFFVALFWFVVRSIDIMGARILERPTTSANAAARSLIPLGARALKIALVAVATIVTLSALGYPVGSLIAGLGIGGVALALAAQKTVENLFGSLSIGVDQPFRVGDYIAVDGLTGTVESIGLRSTRIRTLDRTLVTIPNGKLADMRVESFTERDRIRLFCTLPLDRTTSLEVVRATLQGVREMLAAHPKVAPGASATLAKIGEVSLDLEVMVWFQTTSWDEFLLIREDALLGLLEAVEKAGARLAYPTRELRVRR